VSDSSVEIARFVVFIAEDDAAARTAVHAGEPRGMQFTATFAQLCALDAILTGEDAGPTPWEHHEDTSTVSPVRDGLAGTLAGLDGRTLRQVARLWASTPEGRSSGWNAGYAARTLRSLQLLGADAVATGSGLYFWSWVNPDLLLLVGRPEAVARR
jgi:hypothetical protein